MPMTKSQNINSSEYVTIKHRPLSFVRGQKKLPPQEGQPPTVWVAPGIVFNDTTHSIAQIPPKVNSRLVIPLYLGTTKGATYKLKGATSRLRNLQQYTIRETRNLLIYKAFLQ